MGRKDSSELLQEVNKKGKKSIKSVVTAQNMFLNLS